MMKKSLIILVLSVFVGIGCASFNFVNAGEVTTVKSVEFIGTEEIEPSELQVLMGIDTFSDWDEIDINELEIKLMEHNKVETVEITFGLKHVLNVKIVEAKVVAAILKDSWCHLYSNGHLECSIQIPWEVPIVSTDNNYDINNLKKVSRYLVGLSNSNNKIYSDLSMINWNKDEVEFFFVSHKIKVIALIEMDSKSIWERYDLLTTTYINKVINKTTLDLRFDGYAFAS